MEHVTRPYEQCESLKNYRVMNEVVPQSPDRGSEFDDENSYVPETPQPAASPPTCNGIPIPSLTRIRRSLGVLDNSPPRTTPSLRQCCQKSLGDKRHASRFESCSEDNLHFFKRVRVSLFHDKRKEKEGAKVRESFCVSTKAFYGSGCDREEPKFFVSTPDVAKAAVARSAKRKRSRPLFWSNSKKRSIRRHKTGEINCGIGHGIKKPKSNKRSLSNSAKSEKKKFSPTQINLLKREENDTSGEAVNDVEKIELYDASKKFFKYKYITRLKAKLCGALNDIENSSDSANEKLNTNQVNNCEGITNCLDLKSKNCTNQSVLNKTVECSTASHLVELGTEIQSHRKDACNISTNNWNELDKTAETKNNHLNVSNICNTSESDKTKQSNLLQTNNFSIIETEKNTPADQSTADSLSFLEDKMTDNAENDENTKENEKDSIKKQKEIITETVQSKVVNRQYLINTKEVYFNEECKECQEYNLIYKFSGENNNDIHKKYHDSFQNLKFQEWKNQRIVYEESETRIKVIIIKSNDYVVRKAALERLLNLVTEENSVDDCNNLLNNANNKVYLLVKDDIIISILVAGITIIQDSILSKPNVMFGVGFIWTAKSFRRQKIASRLIDVMRSHFDEDYRIAIDRIAFSKNFLTPDGTAFAVSYTKSSAIKVY